MNRHLRTLLGALCVGLLLTPLAFAQTPATTQTQAQRAMTPAEMQQQRTDMTQRMERMDRDWRDYERRAGAVRDAQRRTTAQQNLQQMRDQREALRRDFTALEGLQGQEYTTRQRDLQQRMDQMDTALYQARLGTAETRDAYRQMVGDRMNMYTTNINRHSQRLADIPERHRGEAAYSLIQLRSRQDDLTRRHRAMARADQARFAADRDAYTRDLTAFERDLYAAEGTMMGYHRGTQGQMQQGQQGTQPGQMQPTQQQRQENPPQGS